MTPILRRGFSNAYRPTASAASPEPSPEERRAAEKAEREAAESDRVEQYELARQAIEAKNAEKDRARALADGRDKPASPTEALGTANALIDRARQNPGDRSLAAQAMEAAAVAGLVSRQPCFACGNSAAHPFPLPGHDVLGSAWACDPCARGNGRADSRALLGQRSV